MDGEDQRQAVEPGGCGPNREDGEVLAEVHVHHIGPCGEDGGEDGHLGGVELAKAPYGETQAYHAGVVAEALEVRRGRWACGQHRLEDAAPVERPGELGGVVLHPPYGVELYASPDERRRGWLEHRADPKHPDPGSIPAPHLSRASRKTPCGVRSTSATPYYSHQAPRGSKGRCEGEGARERPRQRWPRRQKRRHEERPESPCKGPGRYRFRERVLAILLDPVALIVFLVLVLHGAPQYAMGAILLAVLILC